MAKKSFKVICETSNQNQSTIIVEFSIGGETIPPRTAGEIAMRAAPTGIRIMTSDKKEMEEFSIYKPGKQYTITIE